MSMTIEKIIEKLNILQKIPDNPELILTSLFEGLTTLNFLCAVNIEDIPFNEFIQKYLCRIPVFADCNFEVSGNGSQIRTIIPTSGDWNNFRQNKSLIIKINPSEKTYVIYTDDISYYISVMSEKCVLEKEEELCEPLKKLDDLSFKARIKNAFSSLSSGRLHIRIANFFFYLSAPLMKKKINKVLKEERERINSHNEYTKSVYDAAVKRQKGYQEYAPLQIEKIKQKQAEIKEYLCNLGYTEELIYETNAHLHAPQK